LAYFIKHKAEAIKRTMRADIRSMAGLGFPPNVYDQNGNECINSVLQRDKANTGKKRLSLPCCTRLIRTAVQRQRTEKELAVIGIGDLKVDPAYADLTVTETVFYRKSPQQKQAVLAKFFQQVVRPEVYHVAIPSNNDDEVANSMPLSVSPQQSGILRVPFPVLQEMFNKAGSFVDRREEAIVSAPGANAYPQRYVEHETKRGPLTLLQQNCQNGMKFTTSAREVALLLQHTTCARTL